MVGGVYRIIGRMSIVGGGHGWRLNGGSGGWGERVDVGGDLVGMRGNPSRAYGWRGGSRGGGSIGGA